MVQESSGDEGTGLKLPNISVSKAALTNSANQSTTAVGDYSRFSKLAGASAEDPLMVGSSRFSNKFGGANFTPDSLNNTSLLLGSGAKRSSRPRGHKVSIETGNKTEDEDRVADELLGE